MNIIKNKRGSVGQVRILDKSRVGGRPASMARKHLGLGIPFIARFVNVKFDCNSCIGHAKFKGTHMPSHAAYADGTKVGQRIQTDIDDFMLLSDGVTAPTVDIGIRVFSSRP